MSGTHNLDPDVEIMYAVPGGKFLSRDSVEAVLSRRFNRQPLPRPHEAAVDRVWDNRVAANPKLWNGTKFRIESVDTQANHAVFNLGITCYKDFIGTNWSPDAQVYRELGRADTGNPQVYMSDALGVGALLQTADDCAVLLRRSVHCGEAVGLWDIPGGHPEPQELVGKLLASEIDLSTFVPRRVVDEIFNSIKREICDEVNIPEESITDPLLMGIARNTTSAGRPSSEYFVRCNLTSEAIKVRYDKGDHLEAEETTNIMFIPFSELSGLEENKPEVWRAIAPSAKGCVALYKLATEKR